jgi:excisionase family DNA binding protein
MTTTEEFLTTEETAQLLRLHDRTIRTLCGQARLPGARKLYGKWLIHRPTLVAAFAPQGTPEGRNGRKAAR